MTRIFDGDFAALIRTMRAAADQLDDLPDDQSWTEEQLSALDDVRHAALRLFHIAEATILTFTEGR